jgi:hypothetical protein
MKLACRLTLLSSQILGVGSIADRLAMSHDAVSSVCPLLQWQMSKFNRIVPGEYERYRDPGV